MGLPGQLDPRVPAPPSAGSSDRTTNLDLRLGALASVLTDGFELHESDHVSGSKQMGSWFFDPPKVILVMSESKFLGDFLMLIFFDLFL